MTGTFLKRTSVRFPAPLAAVEEFESSGHAAALQGHLRAGILSALPAALPPQRRGIRLWSTFTSLIVTYHPVARAELPLSRLRRQGSRRWGKHGLDHHCCILEDGVPEGGASMDWTAIVAS